MTNAPRPADTRQLARLHAQRVCFAHSEPYCTLCGDVEPAKAPPVLKREPRAPMQPWEY